jgi:hypothetical protein
MSGLRPASRTIWRHSNEKQETAGSPWRPAGTEKEQKSSDTSMNSGRCWRNSRKRKRNCRKKIPLEQNKHKLERLSKELEVIQVQQAKGLKTLQKLEKE